MLNDFFSGTHAFSALDGFDVIPGLATTIGVTGKRAILLPEPYGKCSSANRETAKLSHAIGDNQIPYFTHNNLIKEDKYTPNVCYSTCLQRLIFTTCNCFDIQQVYAYSEIAPLCGTVRNTALQFSNNELIACLEQEYDPDQNDDEDQDKEQESHDQDQNNSGDSQEAIYDQNYDYYFVSWEMNMLANCFLPYNQSIHDMFNDLKCVKNVKKKFSQEKHRLCDCEPACEEVNYDLTLGQSVWPAQGVETTEISESLISFSQNDKLANYFNERVHNSTAEKVINYLLKHDIEGMKNEESKRDTEIMKNFARVTIYAESLSVQTTEQFPAYQLPQLISDIGKFTLIYCHVSAGWGLQQTTRAPGSDKTRG